MHNFHKYLDDFSNKITNKIISLPELNSCNVLKLVDAIKYIIKVGGKRLRPLLVVEISKILNVSQESAYRVGMAIELIHCYSLVHDDLPAMDDDEIRRGSPTCHVKFDEATAILVGDALQSLAFQVLSDVKTHSDSEIRCKLINELSKSSGVSGMVGGQMLDLIASEKKFDINEIRELQRLKTGELFHFSCIAPCILAEENEVIFKIFKKFSLNLGIAFQIQDDLLDIEGQEDIVGKKINKDSYQGKQTYVSELGVEDAKKKAKSLIDDCIKLIDCFKTKNENLIKITNLIIKRNF